MPNKKPLFVTTIIFSVSAMVALVNASAHAVESPLSAPPALRNEYNQPGNVSASGRCGPMGIKKTFSNSEWYVYGCDDNHTLYVAAPLDSPAAVNHKPFYFIYLWIGNRYKLVSNEPTGAQVLRTSVENELKALTADEIKNLVAQARAHK